MLVVGLSGRALASAARDAGWRPWVVDAFGDRDTRALASGCVVVPTDARLRLARRALLDAVGTIQRTHGPMPIVTAAGLEARPGLVDALAGAGPLHGCDAAALRRLYDVPALFGALGTRGVAVPETRDRAPVPATGWLAKRRGASGGAHVRAARAGRRRRGEYVQREITGPVRTALCLTDGEAVACCGTFAQLAWHPRPPARWRYEGACTAGSGSPALDAAIAHAARTVTGLAKLRGGFGLDFVLDRARGPVLVDVNPRLPATLDLCADAGAVFAAHMRACSTDALLYSRPRPRSAGAHLVVYADRAWTVPRACRWPAGTADRPADGTRIDAGMPVCTLRARAPSPPQALERLHDAYEGLRDVANAQTPGALPERIRITRVGEDS